MTTVLRPFTYINYIDEYLDQLLNNYDIKGPRYFCTYFKFDYENSIIDDREYVQSGNYHLVDEKSGRMWKKIQLLPLWNVETIAPIQNKASEDGVTRDLVTAFTLPDYVGVRPTPKDFLHRYDSVTNKVSNDQPLFIVTNREESHMGKRKVYKIHCKNSYNHLSQLDIPENISSEWIYINHYRKIFEYTAGQLLLSTLSRNFSIFDNINRDEDSSFTYNQNVSMFTTRS